MGFVIILIALAVAGYFIYQSLPETKFQKGMSLLNSGNFEQAILIFDPIFDKHPDALAKLAECKLKQGINIHLKSEQDAITYFNQVLDLRKRLSGKANKDKFQLIEAKAFHEIAQIDLNNSIREKNRDNKRKRLIQNIKFIESSIKDGIEDEFLKLKQKNEYELAEIFFLNGVDDEKSEKFLDAIRFYSSASQYAEKCLNSQMLNNAKARIGICKLKSNQKDGLPSINEIELSTKDYQYDYFFRYAKSLIHDKEYQQAESIISKYFNFSSPSIDKLKELLKAKKIKEAIKKVNEINYNLDQIYDRSFPIEEVKALYESIHNRIEEIVPVIPELSDRLNQIKPSLFNRLLLHYITEDQFANAINLIQKYPAFWESPEMLKNLGICCYSFTAQGNLNEKNYRIVISSWLSAVFSDRVILKSLESTVWDDKYTFTLIESIGSNYEHDEVPENVNYDDVSESNISIGATQKELLHQYEMLLNKIEYESSLSNNINNFYRYEKEALMQIVSIIPEDILFAAPYFAKAYGLNNQIIEELDHDYQEYSNEESLQAGIPYLKDNSGSIVNEYLLAKNVLNNVISAIEKDDLDELSACFRDRNKILLEKYESIHDSVEDTIFNVLNQKIEEDEINDGLIPLMETCIRAVTSNDKLKYQYSNYIANYCVTKVNANKLNNYQALLLMNKSYSYSKDNPRICKNFITLISFNLLDILNDRTKKASEIYKLLDEICQKRSTVFVQSSDELINTRSDLLTQLGKAGADINLLIGDDPISSILNMTSNRTLTSEGLKMKKVLSYMKKLSEGNERTRVTNDPLMQLRQQLGLNF